MFIFFSWRGNQARGNAIASALIGPKPHRGKTIRSPKPSALTLGNRLPKWVFEFVKHPQAPRRSRCSLDSNKTFASVIQIM